MTEKTQVPTLREKPVTEYPDGIQAIYKIMVEVYVEANELKKAADEAANKFNIKNAALVELDTKLGAELDIYDEDFKKSKKSKTKKKA